MVEATATGTLSMVSLLSKLQAEHGHSLTIIYSRRPETPDNIESHFPANASLHCIPMHGLRRWPRAVSTLRSTLAVLEPDAIFLHSSFAGFLGRIATVGILESCRIFYVPHCISFMRRDINAAKRAAFIALEKVAGVRTASYVACSNSELVCIRKNLPKSHCLLVENAIPAGWKKNSSIGTHPLTVINSGQIRPQKNPALFAEIAQKSRLEGLPINFLWLGDGEPGLRGELEASGVDVTGWRTRDQVIEALSSASAFLSTSLWEGLPVALIEAQMTGVPTIASACPGNLDCIDHGTTGWLYQSADEAIKLLCDLVENPARHAAVAEHALQTASQRFGSDRYGREMEDLLNANP